MLEEEEKFNADGIINSTEACVLLIFSKWMQKNGNYEASFGYIVRPYSKQTNKLKPNQTKSKIHKDTRMISNSKPPKKRVGLNE